MYDRLNMKKYFLPTAAAADAPLQSIQGIYNANEFSRNSRKTIRFEFLHFSKCSTNLNDKVNQKTKMKYSSFMFVYSHIIFIKRKKKEKKITQKREIHISLEIIYLYSWAFLLDWALEHRTFSTAAISYHTIEPLDLVFPKSDVHHFWNCIRIQLFRSEAKAYFSPFYSSMDGFFHSKFNLKWIIVCSKIVQKSSALTMNSSQVWADWSWPTIPESNIRNNKTVNGCIQRTSPNFVVAFVPNGIWYIVMSLWL